MNQIRFFKTNNNLTEVLQFCQMTIKFKTDFLYSDYQTYHNNINTYKYKHKWIDLFFIASFYLIYRRSKIDNHPRYIAILLLT